MPSRKSEEIPPFIVMDVLDRACTMDRAGADVVHMEVGEPDFPTPAKIVEAGHRALEKGYTHYTHSLGDPDLREALARFYKRSYGVDADPGRMLCTMGSSPAMLLAFAALLDPGDEVILPDPGYACYPNMIRFVGGTPVPVKVRGENGFQYEPSEIRKKIGPRTKAVIVNSPANPTGCVTSAEVLREIAGLGPLVISDEIYHGMTYEGECRSILEFTPNAFVLGGFSKRWAMTGWRLGWVIAPAAYVRPLQKMQQNFFISPASFVQRAGIVALDEEHPEIPAMIRTYDERRRFLVPELKRLGFGVPVMPRGAFYVFADVRRFTRDCYAFAFEILEKARVAVTPGVDFGRMSEGYVRFSYAASLERIREGVRRLEAFLQGRPVLPSGEPAPAEASPAAGRCGEGGSA
ncbi:MAG: pyridoxal phosphate-dependent aminotransferase, partial [Planctomycetes bacterium]|nr:pyridoxal phosphate-dependent aminotransferase [Planctomycetota bacterium]